MSDKLVHYSEVYELLDDSAIVEPDSHQRASMPRWFSKSGCSICGESPNLLTFSNINEHWGRISERSCSLTHCQNCGWWIVDSYLFTHGDGGWPRHIQSKRWPIIKSVPLNSASVPIDVLRRHLCKNYGDAKEISPQKAEELVLSVFREYYHGAEVNYFRGHTFSSDGGIDLVVVDVDEGQIGVQVKRRCSRKTEPVEQVRSFVAALFLHHFRKGVYVALSSKFSQKSQAVSTNPYLKPVRVELDLMDADRFYGILNSQVLKAANGKPAWLNELGTTENCSNQRYFERLLAQYRSYSV